MARMNTKITVIVAALSLGLQGCANGFIQASNKINILNEYTGEVSINEYCSEHAKTDEGPGITAQWCVNSLIVQNRAVRGCLSSVNDTECLDRNMNRWEAEVNDMAKNAEEASQAEGVEFSYHDFESGLEPVAGAYYITCLMESGKEINCPSSF